LLELINVMSLPLVYNICDGDRNVIELREVWEIDGKASLAVGIIQPGYASFLHKHEHTFESYYIIEGEGQMTVGSHSFRVVAHQTVVLPPHTPHKLRNIGSAPLIHQVFCVPPFDSTDIILLEQLST